MILDFGEGPMVRTSVFMVLVTLVSSAHLFAGDSDTEALRAELHAMRAAYESRISALEGELQQVKTHGLQQQKTSDEKISEALKRAGPSFNDYSFRGQTDFNNAVRSSARVSLGGYFEFNYIDRGDRVASFNQKRAVLELGAQLHDRIRFYGELEYENAAVIESPEETGGELELEQAYLDFEINKALNFRAGVLLVPLGRFNLYHEGHINNFVERPLVNEYVAPTTFFEEGAGFHGVPLDNEWLGISYEAYVMNPARAENVSAEEAFHEIRNEGQDAVSDKKAFAARVAFEPARKFKRFADFFELGLSGYYSGVRGFEGLDDNAQAINLDGGALHIVNFDLTYEKKGFGLRGEMALAHADDGANSTGRDQDAFGYYVEAYYKFWPKFLSSSPFGKGFKDPKLVAAVRFDSIDNDVNKFDRRDLRRVSIDLAYRPIENVAFKLEYQFDHTPSGTAGTELEESGDGKNTDAFLFGVHYGF
jgi:hypothetical protein